MPEPTPTRILIGMPFSDLLGGAERLLATLLKHARHEGLDVRLFLFTPGELQRIAADAGFETSVLDPGRFRNALHGASVVRHLRQTISDWRPDVILSWLPRAHPYLALAATSTGARDRLVWWQHQLGAQERLARLTTALPGRVICTSRAAAEAQARVFPRRRTAVCQPGVEIGPVPSAKVVGALREKLTRVPDTRVVGIVGRLVDWKGQDRFVDAIGLLRGRGHDVVGSIVGDTAHGLESDFKQRVLARIEQAGLTDAVVMAGHVADPTAHVHAMDVLVNASRREPFGMTLLEAMATGTPTVAVNAAGPRDIIEDGVSGILVPDGTPPALAAGIERLLVDRGLSGQVAAGGKARYSERFTGAAFSRRAAEILGASGR